RATTARRSGCGRTRSWPATASCTARCWRSCGATPPSGPRPSRARAPARGLETGGRAPLHLRLRVRGGIAGGPRRQRARAVADARGWGDRGASGAPPTRPPTLARLAAGGARLRDFRVPPALCTPSGGALLPGLSPPRTGLVGNLPSGSPTDGVTDGIDD